MVHSPAECLAVFKEAAYNSQEVVIELPGDAVHYMGLRYIQAMFTEAERCYPEVAYAYICDCGTDAGLVQQAFRIGFKQVRYTGEAAIAGKLQDIAAQYGGVLVCTAALPGVCNFS